MQEQQYYTERMANRDPREQRDGKFYMPAPRARMHSAYRLIRNVVVALIVLGAITGGLILWGVASPLDVTALPEHTFNLSGHTKLIVSDQVGSIHIHSADTNTIVVQGTKRTRGVGTNANDLTIRYDQQGNNVFVTGEEGWGLTGQREIDLDITVPNTIDITASNVNGDINLENITGNVEATSTSSNITANAINGEAKLTTISGDIHMQHAQLHGASNLKTTSGSIDFTGLLDQQGNYHMGSVSGDVLLHLPATSSFRVATSDVSGHVANQFGSDTTGSSPQPALSLSTDSGDITIAKQ